MIDLLELPKDADEVKKAYNELKHNLQIQTLITITKEWFPQSITRHNVPYLSHYKFLMLAEFGLEKTERTIQEIIRTVTSNVENNSFQSGKLYHKRARISLIQIPRQMSGMPCPVIRP